MAKAIKHITAGLLHIEVIGTIPDRPPGRRGRRGPELRHPRRPNSFTMISAPGGNWN